MADENDADDRYPNCRRRNANDVLYQGMAARTFERSFQLADYVQVKSASWGAGLLHVDLVRDSGGDQISGDRDRKLQQASGGQADMGLGSPNCENTIEAFSMMGYGLRVAIISAQARATAESGDGAPGIVAHPPFSTNVPRSQA